MDTQPNDYQYSTFHDGFVTSDNRRVATTYSN